MTDMPAPIQRMIDATNSADSEAFAAAFTENAYLEDWGRKFEGQAGVRAWNASDNIGKQSRFTAGNVRRDGDDFIVTLRVTGNGYQGDGDIRFTIDGDQISRMIITP
jgi:SnoaL-like domain